MAGIRIWMSRAHLPKTASELSSRSARSQRAWMKPGGVVAMAILVAAWFSPGPLLADGSLLLGTASHGSVMVGASAGGLDAYRTVAAATGASNRLWLFVGDGTQGRSVPIGVYDDVGGRLLGSCEIVPPQSLSAWSSCSTARAVQTTAGHTYWLAIGHASNRVIWWAETGALCQSRSIFLRSPTLPDPFPMAQSNCADDGSNVALYLGDAEPPAEVRSSPTPVPTASSIPAAPATSTSLCVQVTVNGAPGAGQVNVIYGPTSVKVVRVGAITGVGDGLDLKPGKRPVLASVGTLERPVFALSLTEPSRVRLLAYDVAGRRQAVLADGALPAGTTRYPIPIAIIPDGVIFVQAEVTGGSGTTMLRARAVKLK